MKEGLIGALLGAVVTVAVGGVDTFYNVRNESDRLKQEHQHESAQLEQEAIRLEGELKEAEANRKIAEENLRLAQEEQESSRVEVYGQAAQQIEAARRSFNDPDATDEERAAAVRRLAASIVENSRRPELEPVSISQPLPPGTHDRANALANLLKQQLFKADLSRADLHGQYFQGAILDRILLRSADLRAVDFSNASLQSTYFEGALLQCADLSGAQMDAAQLAGADLSWSDLRGVDLTGVVGLSAEQLTGVAYDDATKWPDSISEADLKEPSEYSEPRLCIPEHLTGATTGQSSPQPQPSPTG